MNKIFKVIYNKSKGCYTVVSELAKGKTKSQSRKTKTALTMAVVLGLSVGFMGTTFADGINISQTNNDGKVQQGNTLFGTNKILIGTDIKNHSGAANSETGSIAIGDKIAYGGDSSIAIGTDLKTSNDNSILIGSNMSGDAFSTQVIAIGNKIGAEGTYNLGDTQRLIAIGNDVITEPLTQWENFNSVIIGNNSKVTGNNNIVLGNKSSDEKLMEQTTKHDNKDENADPEDATIFILPNGSGFGGAALNKKTGDGYLVIGNEDSSRRIAYVAAGVDDSDAANMEQLRSLAKNKISLGGDTGQTNKLELGVENLTTPNDNRLKFNITGDGNYISTAAGVTSVSTSFKTDKFVADQLPVTFVNADGKKLVKMKVTNGGATTEGFYVIDDLVDGKVSAGTDPVAPSDVFLSLANPTSTNPNKAGEPIKLLNIKNVLALSNMPIEMSNAAAFDTTNTRLVRNMLTGAPEQGITPDPNQTAFYNISGSDLYRPVTVGDLQAIASAGITFKATTGDEVVRRLGETLTIKGGGMVFNTDFSAKNITTKTDNNELIIGLKTAPDFNKITFHDGKANISNDSESNPTQFIFQGAQQTDGTYSKMKLTNLADANIVANNTDAVTGGQIFSSLKTVSSDVIAIKANNANGQAVTPKMWLDGNTATNVFLTLNDKSITEKKLADDAVTTDKIANNAVTTNKIANNSIPIGKLNTTLQTTINSIGDKLDASRAQFTISDSKTNSTINLNTDTAPTIVVKSGNTSALQVALNSTDNTFTITPQTYAGNFSTTLATKDVNKLVTAASVKTALDNKLDTSKALFKIQDDTTTQKSMSLNTTTPPVVRVKGDSSVIEVKFDGNTNDLKVSAKTADTTAANFVNDTNKNLLATPLGVKNYIDSLKAPTTANDFGNTTNGGKLATAQGVVNYVNANKVKYFSVNTSSDGFVDNPGTANINNDGAKGLSSIVIGAGTQSVRNLSLFIGNKTTDHITNGYDGIYTTVVGNNNSLQNSGWKNRAVTSLGTFNTIAGDGAINMGVFNRNIGHANVSIGNFLEVSAGGDGESIGISASKINNGGTSTDTKSYVLGPKNIGIGSGIEVGTMGSTGGQPTNAIGIGYKVKVKKVGGIAIGDQAESVTLNGIALGASSYTTSAGSKNGEMSTTGYDAAIGTSMAVDSTNSEKATWKSNLGELSIGKYNGADGVSEKTRRIANVAAGVLDADAVNVAQLKQITLGVQDDNATTTNKLYMKLYDDTNKKVNLLNMVSDTDKNIKVTVVPSENKVKFGLKSDLKGITSITNTEDGSTTTGGATLTISNDGLKVTTGTNPNENNILIGKDGKISGLADADISATSTDAVTGKQLKALADNVNTTINNLTGTMVYTDDAGNKLTKVGDKFYKTSALSNYALANDGKYYDKTKVNPLTGEVTDKTATSVDLANTVPQTDQVTADKVITSAVNSDGSTTSAQTISNLASGLGLDNMNKTATGGTVSNADKQSNAGSTTITSDNARTSIAGTNKDGKGGIYTLNGNALHKVATIGDLQAVSMAGLTFTADETGKEIHRPLGTALKISATNSITATNTADFTTTNLGTKIDTTNNVISIEMKKALTNINSITSTANTDLVLSKGEADKPSIKISDDGLTVTMPNPAGATTTINPIIIGKDGKITGLANGTADTDAVNVSQLNNKADKDGSNLVTTTGTTKSTALNSTAQSNWATALGTGTIGSGDTANGGKATDNNLVTGKTVYDSIKDMVKYDSDKHDTITLGIPAGQTGATTTKITNLTDGEITSTSTDAVTGKQIKSIVDNVNTNINNLTSTMVYTDDAGNRLTKVGDKFYKTSALENYALANDGKYYEKSKVDPVTGAVENGAQEVDLATTVTGDDQVAADKVITSAVNGSGSTTSAQTIGNIASGLGLDNMKVLDNGTQANTSSTAITQDKAAKVIAGDNKDGKGGLLTKSGVELHKVATVGDLQALAMAGLTFTADEENKEIHRPLGTALKIVTGTAIISSPKAGANPDPNAKTPNDDKFTNANLGTRIDDADNVIGIQMKKDLTDINSITSTANTDLVLKKGGTDKPSVKISDDGLTVTMPNQAGATTTINPIIIGKDGKITGLANGEADTDAVNVSQLNTKADKDASNLVREKATSTTTPKEKESALTVDEQTNWGTALGTGVVAQGDGKLVTGDTVYKAVSTKLDSANAKFNLAGNTGTGLVDMSTGTTPTLTISSGNTDVLTTTASNSTITITPQVASTKANEFADATNGKKLATAEGVKNFGDANYAKIDASNLVDKTNPAAPTSKLTDENKKDWATALASGSDIEGNTQKNTLVTDTQVRTALDNLKIQYKANDETKAKEVKLSDGLNFKSGTGTIGTSATGTDTEKAKKGIVIETKDNGEIVIGLDEETRKKIDETMDEVVVVDGDNTTAVEDTDNQEAGKKKYKVNINKDLNNINSITSEKDNDLTLSRKDGSKVVLEDNAINLTAGTGTDAKTITINKDGTVSGVSSGLKLDNTTPIDKAGATAALNGIEDKANPANNKPGLLGTTGDALNNIATIKDLQAVAQGGLTFKSDGGEEIHRPLGSALSITTGIKVNDANKTAYEFASPNLGTVVNPANGTINFVFKSQPTFNGISFSGGPNGNVLNMNNQGQLFITKEGKDELLGINVKKFDGKSYFVPLNGTIEFKDTANVVADVTGQIESSSVTTGTGGVPSTAPATGSASRKTPSITSGTTFFDGADDTTDAQPPASTTVDATVEWKIPDNAPIKITIDESKMTDDQIVNKKYVDSKLGPVVNNMTQITNHINVIRQESNAGIASAFAASHVPQVINTSDRNLVGVGFGSYHGANAVAIGLSGTNRSRTVVWKLTGTYDSSNSFGIGAGLGFSYGPKNRYKDEENNVLKPAKLNDFNERITRQQIEIDTLKDFIKDMQEQHKAEIEELKNQIKTMQTH